MNCRVPELTTERLLLRSFRPDDFEAHAAMCADAEVMTYLGTDGPMERQDAWRQLALLMGHWQLRGFGTWALEERQTGRFVGRIGLHFPEGWPGREIGWALAREFWGRGYATEAGQAVLEYAFETLRWSRVISLILPGNERSARLAERLGERLDGQADVKGHQVNVYAVTRTEWRASRPAVGGQTE